MPDEEERRRFPSKFKDIENVTSEDVRVSIIGTVVDREETILIVDDGTGKIEVEFDLSENLENFEEGDKVRVIGRPNEEILNGEVIQDFSDLDLELYNEAKSKIEDLKTKFKG